MFSLTSLQGFITSKFSHFSSDKVLNICQSLYEGKGKGGYITYPRTDSIYLEESLVDKTSKTLEKLKKGLPFESSIKFTKTKRVFDSSKVDSHSAITPTYIIPTSLTPDEAIVYNAIKDRFIANFMPPAQYENTEITTSVDKNTFVTKGKVLKVKGYLEIYNKEQKDDLLPMLDKNEIVDVLDIKPITKQTTPPKSYTEDTLLKAMKNCGKNISDDDADVLSGYSIGTSATRADVLKKIGQVGYVTKKGKSYFITDLGQNLVEIFPVKELFDVDYTGKLEKSLNDIQKGEFTRKEYLNNIMSFIWKSVNLIKYDSPKKISTENFTYNAKTKKFVSDKPIVTKNTKSSKSQDTTPLGKCPVCGKDVLESEKGFFCLNYDNCKYGIFKNDKYLQLFKKKPTKTMVKNLLKKGETKVKSMTGKDGNKFDAILKYEKNSNGYYSWLIKKDI